MIYAGIAGFITLLALFSQGGAIAADKKSPSMYSTNLDHKTTDGLMTSGVVVKVEQDTAKLTIKHDSLKNLGMPAMTMVFRVTDLNTLKDIKVGDQVRFIAENLNGHLTVVELKVLN